MRVYNVGYSVDYVWTEKKDAKKEIREAIKELIYRLDRLEKEDKHDHRG